MRSRSVGSAAGAIGAGPGPPSTTVNGYGDIGSFATCGAWIGTVAGALDPRLQTAELRAGHPWHRVRARHLRAGVARGREAVGPACVAEARANRLGLHDERVGGRYRPFGRLGRLGRLGGSGSFRGLGRRQVDDKFGFAAGHRFRRGRGIGDAIGDAESGPLSATAGTRPGSPRSWPPRRRAGSAAARRSRWYHHRRVSLSCTTTPWRRASSATTARPSWRGRELDGAKAGEALVGGGEFGLLQPDAVVADRQHVTVRSAGTVDHDSAVGRREHRRVLEELGEQVRHRAHAAANDVRVLEHADVDPVVRLDLGERGAHDVDEPKARSTNPGPAPNRPARAGSRRFAASG